jgi:protein-S-isoprenylcysteine O-methyltransferase Ste14
MHLLDQRTLGIVILLLLGLLIVAKRAATGSIIDLPKGSIQARLADGFNLFFLLIVNPLAAVLLIARRMDALDPTHLAISGPWLLTVEIVGMVLYGLGFLLMSWALLTLRGNYQVGGSAPRAADRMVLAGPYRFIRHPMYAAALSIALGLVGLIQSVACLVIFCIYLVLIVRLIPVEEEGLGQAYHERFITYRQHTRRLVPFLY